MLCYFQGSSVITLIRVSYSRNQFVLCNRTTNFFFSKLSWYQSPQGWSHLLPPLLQSISSLTTLSSWFFPPSPFSVTKSANRPTSTTTDHWSPVVANLRRPQSHPHRPLACVLQSPATFLCIWNPSLLSVQHPYCIDNFQRQPYSTRRPPANSSCARTRLGSSNLHSKLTTSDLQRYFGFDLLVSVPFEGFFALVLGI